MAVPPAGPEVDGLDTSHEPLIYGGPYAPNRQRLKFASSKYRVGGSSSFPRGLLKKALPFLSSVS